MTELLTRSVFYHAYSSKQLQCINIALILVYTNLNESSSIVLHLNVTYAKLMTEKDQNPHET